MQLAHGVMQSDVIVVSNSYVLGGAHAVIRCLTRQAQS